MSDEAHQPAEIPGLEVTESKEYHLLPVETRAQLALASSKTEADLIALAAKHQGITQIVDKAGREQAHGAAMELMRARTTVVNVAKAARDDATKFSKAVIAEEARLVAIVEAEEKRLKDLRDAWDREQERIKAEKAEAERKRLLAIGERITEIKGYPVLAQQCRTSDGVKRLVERLEAVAIEGFDEFETDAAMAKSVALETRGATLRSKQEAEAEAKRLADERAALERARLEQEERQRQLDAQAAELARQQQEIEAAREAAKPEVILVRGDVLEAQLRAKLEPAPLVLATETTVIPLSQGGDTGPVVTHAHTPNMPPVSHRPTDDEIVDALALHFRVHESKVIEWLLAMDLQAASARLSTEFA